MSSIRDSEVAVESQWLPSIRGGDEIRELMLRIRTISLRMALDQDPQNIATYRSQMDTRDKELSEKIAAYDKLVTTAEGQRCTSSSKVPSPPIAPALPNPSPWPIKAARRTDQIVAG
jgi:hypothetical protein